MPALQNAKSVLGGWIHIPYSPTQAAYHPGAPCLAVDTVVHGLRTAIHTAPSTSHDLVIGAGAEH